LRRFARLSFDELVQQTRQGVEGRKIHDHCDVAADVALANLEVDVEKHHDIAGLGWGRKAEEGRCVAAQHFRQRHLQAALKHVGDGSQTTVQKNIARLGQRLLFQFDDVFERKIAPGDRADKFETLRLRKDQKRPAGDVAFEDLVDCDQVRNLAFGQNGNGARSALQRDIRYRKMDLFAVKMLIRKSSMRRATTVPTLMTVIVAAMG
jgi:hypothetical protein